MAELSKMIAIGTIAPGFNLIDVLTHKKMSLQSLKSDKATVIMFICRHCPYVKLIQKELVTVSQEYQQKGVRFIAICSNDSEAYPEDSPEGMLTQAQENAFPFPYLHDETQAVAKAYHAACTPDLFVFDKELACVYRGRFDDATPGNKKTVTGNDLRHALDCILANKPISHEQHPSMGCSIKWKH